MKNTVTQKDTIKAFAEKQGLTLKASKDILEAVSDFIFENLKAGNGIKLKKVGTIYPVVREAHQATVPASDRVVSVPARLGFRLKSKRYDLPTEA